MSKELTFNTPQEIKTFMQAKFGACGCSEITPMLTTLKEFLLEKTKKVEIRYDYLFNGDLGVFYIIAGIATEAGLLEHGTSIRYSWLTFKGISFLKALSKFTFEEIEESEVEIYDISSV